VCAGVSGQQTSVGWAITKVAGSGENWTPRELRHSADAPEAILWAALSLAPEGSTTVPELMEATGVAACGST
jgi:hypothetical protein